MSAGQRFCTSGRGIRRFRACFQTENQQDPDIIRHRNQTGGIGDQHQPAQEYRCDPGDTFTPQGGGEHGKIVQNHTQQARAVDQLHQAGKILLRQLGVAEPEQQLAAAHRGDVSVPVEGPAPDGIVAVLRVLNRGEDSLQGGAEKGKLTEKEKDGGESQGVSHDPDDLSGKARPADLVEPEEPPDPRCQHDAHAGGGGHHAHGDADCRRELLLSVKQAQQQCHKGVLGQMRGLQKEG